MTSCAQLEQIPPTLARHVLVRRANLQRNQGEREAALAGLAAAQQRHPDLVVGLAAWPMPGSRPVTRRVPPGRWLLREAGRRSRRRTGPRRAQQQSFWQHMARRRARPQLMRSLSALLRQTRKQRGGHAGRGGSGGASRRQRGTRSRIQPTARGVDRGAAERPLAGIRPLKADFARKQNEPGRWSPVSTPAIGVGVETDAHLSSTT